MSKNILIYPDDFTTTKSGNTDGQATALELAVTNLQVTTRDTALRQAHIRRTAGQEIVATQNKLLRTTSRRMPLYAVGPINSGPSFLGTTAYIAGSAGLQCFNYSNEIFRRSSAKTPDDRGYGATIGNSESGKLAGGGGIGGFSQVIDKIKYYPSEQVLGSVAQLSEPRVGIEGQMGDATRGIMIGGANSYGILKNDAHLYTHSTDTVNAIANFLQRTRFAPHGGLSSKFAGYTMGGSDAYFAGGLLTSIEKISYSTQITGSVSISGSVPHSHVVHAAFGNDVKGYLAGGSNSSPPGLQWPSDAITGFTFLGETAVLLSTKLTNQLCCSFGAGSSANGYVFSGWVDNTLSSLTNSGVFKLRFSDETAFVVESRLLEEAWDKGAVSDYGAGFS